MDSNTHRPMPGQEKIVSVITLGDQDRILKDSKKLDVDLTGVRIINPAMADKLSDFTNIFFNLRKHKGITILPEISGVFTE